MNNHSSEVHEHGHKGRQQSLMMKQRSKLLWQGSRVRRMFTLCALSDVWSDTRASESFQITMHLCHNSFKTQVHYAFVIRNVTLRPALAYTEVLKQFMPTSDKDTRSFSCRVDLRPGGQDLRRWRRRSGTHVGWSKTCQFDYCRSRLIRKYMQQNLVKLGPTLLSWADLGIRLKQSHLSPHACIYIYVHTLCNMKAPGVALSTCISTMSHFFLRT